MNLTADFLERRLMEHREWQELELERLCDEVLGDVAPAVDNHYRGLGKVTISILNGLGR